MKPYTEIDHTADTALEIYGNTLEQLFKNAAKGFYYLVSVPDKIHPNDYRELNLQENSLEDLLISFLNELNYYLMVHSSVFSKFEHFYLKQEKETWKLYCKGKLALLEAEAVANMQEIKAVTYHQIRIEKKDQIYFTQIIFDI